MKELVERIRKIESELIALGIDDAMPYSERMERVWELQLRLRRLQSRLVDMVEAQAA